MGEVKVKVHETAEVNQAAPMGQQVVTVTDARGRVFSLKEPDVLAPYRIVQVVGGESAENRVYMNMIMPLLYLSTIDGDAVFTPASKREVDALIQRLGHDGVRVLRAGVETHFNEGNEEAEATIKK